MHPEVIKNAPGKCPICGMNLISKTTATNAGHTVKQKGGHHDHASACSNTTDPTMAKQMEKEMRIGFIVSLILAIPVVLYSSLGQKILGVNLPAPLPVSLAFPDGGVNLLSLLLASLVVFWPGWIFISGAYYALKKKTLDMAVLIATGVLAAYIYSFAMTIFAGLKGETFLKRRRCW